jgi:hypothetical protein
MTRLEALTALKEAVEAGAWPLLYPRTADLPDDFPFDAFNGSLDAARSLHDAVLPGGFWFVGHLDAPELGYVATLSAGTFADSPSWRAFNICPARAWLIAILTALIAQVEDEG